MGGRADRQACADGERGPPSARAEIHVVFVCVECTMLTLLFQDISISCIKITHLFPAFDHLVRWIL
jgi:hypothetical protein